MKSIGVDQETAEKFIAAVKWLKEPCPKVPGCTREEVLLPFFQKLRESIEDGTSLTNMVRKLSDLNEEDHHRRQSEIRKLIEKLEEIVWK